VLKIRAIIGIGIARVLDAVNEVDRDSRFVTRESLMTRGCFATELLAVANVVLLQEISVLEDIAIIEAMVSVANNAGLLICRIGLSVDAVDTCGVDMVVSERITSVWDRKRVEFFSE
jgi:hypothetical protein